MPPEPILAGKTILLYVCLNSQRCHESPFDTDYMLVLRCRLKYLMSIHFEVYQNLARFLLSVTVPNYYSYDRLYYNCKIIHLCRQQSASVSIRFISHSSLNVKYATTFIYRRIKLWFIQSTLYIIIILTNQK